MGAACDGQRLNSRLLPRVPLGTPPPCAAARPHTHTLPHTHRATLVAPSGPQETTRLPKAVKGVVGDVLSKKDEKKMLDHYVKILGFDCFLLGFFLGGACGKDETWKCFSSFHFPLLPARLATAARWNVWTFLLRLCSIVNHPTLP